MMPPEPLVTPAYCQLLARYNRWMNERLVAVAGEFDDAERRRDRGAVFGSMQGTLNHILWGDRVWLGRFDGAPCTHPAFGADLCADFAEFVRERERTDTRILDWAGQVTPEWLAGELRYTSQADGRQRALPNAVAAIHLFQHATHHRGQLTTLIRQAGRDPGVTDLPWLPGVVREVIA
jgi:uncharacterized damage-inducible protein DinB